MKLRTFIFHPLTVLSLSILATLSFCIAIILRSKGHTTFYSLYYVAPIGISFFAFLFDRAENAKELNKKQIYIDTIIIVASLLRMEYLIPFYSGHALFLTYAIFATRTWVARLTAIAVMIQVLYLKIFVWGSVEVFGGILFGLAAGLIFLKQTKNSLPRT
jgi:hypothetical protein